MKTLWNIIAVMAIANLLGVLGFVAWLVATDRLDRERVEEIRALISGETITAEVSRERREAAEQIEAMRVARIEALPDGAPVLSEDAIALRDAERSALEQRLMRLRRESADLQADVEAKRLLLDGERAAFAGERAAFEAQLERIREFEGEAQFEKVVKTLEELKPADAATLLGERIARGEMLEAVVYLNAMKPRGIAAIIQAFVKDGQEPLAAELLDGLKGLGVETLPVEDSTEDGA